MIASPLIAWLEDLDAPPAPADAWVLTARGPDPGVAARPAFEDLSDAAVVPSSDGGAARLLRRRMLRALAARVLSVPAEAIAFERRDGVTRITAPRPMCASAAGRGVWQAVALSAHPVGVDLELTANSGEAARLWPALAPRKALEQWTAAEAWAKASGRPLDQALASGRRRLQPGAVVHRADYVACAVVLCPPDPESFRPVWASSAWPRSWG